MSEYNFWDELIESGLAVVAILALTYLGLNGVIKLELIGAIATLGGAKSYRKYKQFKNGG